MTYESVVTPIRAMFGIERHEPHWTDGRLVVIRPDVPGKRCNPEDSFVVRTPDERAALDIAVSSVVSRVREGRGMLSDWSCPGTEGVAAVKD